MGRVRIDPSFDFFERGQTQTTENLQIIENIKIGSVNVFNSILYIRNYYIQEIIYSVFPNVSRVFLDFSR